MVQKRRMFPHLLDNTIVTESRGREVSMGDADTSYAARRNYRTGQVTRNGPNYNNTDYLEDIPSPKGRVGAKYLKNVVPEDDDEITEVIDMGSPKLPRRVIQSEETLSDSNGDAKTSRPVKLKCTYKPNPRLYPGPQRKPIRKRRASARGDSVSKTSSPSAGHKGRKYPKRRRIVRFTPNPRLYRPPPRRVPPPNTPPKKWTPPDSRQSALDTASKVAMQLAESAERQENRQIIFDRNALNQEYERHEKGKFVCNRCEAPQTKRQVTYKKRENPREKWEVIYNKNASDSPDKVQTTYKMTQKNVKFKMNVPGTAIEGTCPPEILTEFLAAIMHGQYGEALQYCRMILEFEPQNTTAQGFYPLLHQKVKAMKALYSRDSESSGKVMRANLHPEDSLATVKRGPREHYDGDRNWSDPSTSSLGTSVSPMSQASRDDDLCLPNSPGDISSVSSRKFDEISNARLKNMSKVSFAENPNARVSRSPSLEKLRSMFTHSLINSTEISANVQD